MARRHYYQAKRGFPSTFARLFGQSDSCSAKRVQFPGNWVISRKLCRRIYSFLHAFRPQITFMCVHSSNNRCYQCALSKVIDIVNVGWFAVEEQRGAPGVRHSHSYLISRTGSIYSKQFTRKRGHMKIFISGHVREGFANMFGLKCLRLNLI